MLIIIAAIVSLLLFELYLWRRRRRAECTCTRNLVGEIRFEIMPDVEIVLLDPQGRAEYAYHACDQYPCLTSPVIWRGSLYWPVADRSAEYQRTE